MRQIIYDPRFEAESKLLFTSPEEADDRLRAVEWELARVPEFTRYKKLRSCDDGRSVYYTVTEDHGAPIVVVFSVNVADTEICLLGICPYERDEDEWIAYD